MLKKCLDVLGYICESNKCVCLGDAPAVKQSVCGLDWC